VLRALVAFFGLPVAADDADWFILLIVIDSKKMPCRQPIRELYLSTAFLEHGLELEHIPTVKKVGKSIIKYRKITDILLVTDTISIYRKTDI